MDDAVLGDLVEDYRADRHVRGWLRAEWQAWRDSHSIVREYRSAQRGPARPWGFGDLNHAWRGIGIVFSAVDALVLNPAPYPDAERLVTLVDRTQGKRGPSVSKVHACALLERPGPAAAIVAYGSAIVFVTGHVWVPRSASPH